MVYLVTWDLNKEGSAYSIARARLMEGFNFYETNYNSSLDSVRFVSTEESANQIYEFLKEYKDDDDTIVIVKLEKGTDNHQGNLGKSLWEWINARI
jgi:hypothetical protein